MSKLSHDSDHLVVVAIDFGTTYSGYGFSMVSNPARIFMNKDWSQVGQLKTPTSVLTSSTGEFVEFGYKAEQMFSAHAAEAGEGDEELCLFQHFKMELHKLNKLNDKILVKSKDNKASLKAFELVRMALEHIKEHAVTALSKVGVTSQKESEVRWVVTVPAIWSDASKRFMREAAFKADIIKDVDSEYLTIALEPEAAALYIRSLDADSFAVETNTEASAMETGTKYIVVDVGGGTVDIAVHEVTGPGRAKELFYPTGGHWGGTRVNEAFDKLITKVLGDNATHQLKETCPHAWWELMSQFEMKKRKFSGTKAISIPLSNVLSTAYKDITNEDIVNAFTKAKSQGVDCRQGLILVKGECMKSVFDESVAEIISHLESLFAMDRMQGVECMMVVGGYSESPYLQQAIRNKFKGMVDILIPQDASLAVVKGAVMFGHNPNSIVCRRAKKSYGIGVYSVFQPDLHDSDHRQIIHGREMARDVFSALIRKDAEVQDDFTRQHSFVPLRGADTSVTFVMYVADSEHVMYIDEPGVEEVTRIRMELEGDHKTGSDKRSIGMMVTFGGTEIKIEITDQSRQDGVSKQAELFFDTT